MRSLMCLASVTLQPLFFRTSLIKSIIEYRLSSLSTSPWMIIWILKITAQHLPNATWCACSISKNKQKRALRSSRHPFIIIALTFVLLAIFPMQAVLIPMNNSIVVVLLNRFLCYGISAFLCNPVNVFEGFMFSFVIPAMKNLYTADVFYVFTLVVGWVRFTNSNFQRFVLHKQTQAFSINYFINLWSSSISSLVHTDLPLWQLIAWMTSTYGAENNVIGSLPCPHNISTIAPMKSDTISTLS